MAQPDSDPRVCPFPGCGRPKTPGVTYCRACEARWAKVGYRGEAPPPPISPAQAAALRFSGERPDPGPDPYDVEWAAAAGDRLAASAEPRAEALARCVRASDAHGVAAVLLRAQDSMPALLVVLAAGASQHLIRYVTRVAGDPRVRRAAQVADSLAGFTAAESASGIRDLLAQWVRTPGEAAAIAVVLAECQIPDPQRGSQPAASGGGRRRPGCHPQAVEGLRRPAGDVRNALAGLAAGGCRPPGDASGGRHRAALSPPVNRAGLSLAHQVPVASRACSDKASVPATAATVPGLVTPRTRITDREA